MLDGSQLMLAARSSYKGTVIWTFAHHRVKHSDFRRFKGVT